MERAFRTLTVAIAAFSFLYLAFAMIVPWRRPDRLTLTLCGLLLTWGILLGLGLLQIAGLLPLLLPKWEQWLVSVTLDVLGVLGVVFVEMYRRKR